MGIRYRKATVDDAVRLLELRRQSILVLAPRGMTFAQSETWASKMTLEGMKDRMRETEVLVAELNDLIVGWVAFEEDYLDGLYTDPDFAQQGVGTGLLSLTEKLIRDAGVKSIRLEASWNAEAWYMRRGYEPTGPRPPDGARPLAKSLCPTPRLTVLENIAQKILCVNRPHPVRVAIDGVDGAGKTALADELVGPIRAAGRPVIRVSVDGFHNPRNKRYRLGRHSPEGYFRDSFDYDALITGLLAPLGPGGSLRYRRAIFDYRTDSKINAPLESAPANAVLLLDGIFLLRPEIRSHWDFSVFLDVPFETSVSRMAQRNGSSPEVHAIENSRYVEGQEIYLNTCQPTSVAMLVVDNEKLPAPRVIVDRT